jgi:predicted GIY-YIG superfamily endonuclease
MPFVYILRCSDNSLYVAMSRPLLKFSGGSVDDYIWRRRVPVLRQLVQSTS